MKIRSVVSDEDGRDCSSVMPRNCAKCARKRGMPGLGYCMLWVTLARYSVDRLNSTK